MGGLGRGRGKGGISGCGGVGGLGIRWVFVARLGLGGGC